MFPPPERFVRIRLYVDEDAMDNDLVQALRARGVDVITALEAGKIERPDREHLDHATAQGRVLYSFNGADFWRLHTTYMASARAHAGMVLAHQQRYSVGEQARRLLKLIATKSAEEMKNWVDFLGHWD